MDIDGQAKSPKQKPTKRVQISGSAESITQVQQTKKVRLIEPQDGMEVNSLAKRAPKR